MISKYFFCGMGLLKLFFLRCFYWNRMKTSLYVKIYPSVSFEIDKNARVVIGKNVSIRKRCEINARNDARVVIGENSFLNSACILTAHKGIEIGNNVEFGPHVLIFDHDHKYKNGYKAKEFESDKIIIGNNVWIGANAIILRGTIIGDNSVVAAGSVLKGKYPANSLIYTKREIGVKEISQNRGCL